MNNAGSGTLRRRVILAATGHAVLAGVEDDFHHFVVKLEHDGSHVTNVGAESRRTPWVTCPQSSMLLKELIGVPLTTEIHAGTRHIDPHSQCTHQYDLARMALAQAVRGGRRQYDIEVTDPVDGIRRVLLARDGQTLIDWRIKGVLLLSPPELAGINVRKMNMQALAASDQEMAEAVSVVRRALMLSEGRGIDYDRIPDPTVFADRMSGACYSFQPGRIPFATRNKGTVRDFTDTPDLPLKGFPA
ncbi:MAG: DUF2889 domain-containing protein [Gammaproteobacteria bacterium]|nr:DUF2889 domain-containing protein [Gammaproteobacteria bacterium]